MNVSDLPLMGLFLIGAWILYRGVRFCFTMLREYGNLLGVLLIGPVYFIVGVGLMALAVAWINQP